MDSERYYFKHITGADIKFLEDMLYLAIYVVEGEIPLNREIIYHPDLYKYVDQWDNKKDLGYILVHQETNSQIGAVWLRPFEESNQGYGYIDKDIPELSIAIYPTHRGKGFGTQLMQHLIENLPPVITTVSLSVDIRNPAKRLYERLGFKNYSIHDYTAIMKYDSSN